MSVIVVGHSKGGPGKTMLATALACAYAMGTVARGWRRVLLIDADPQWHAKLWGKRAAKKLQLPNLEVISAREPNLHLSNLDANHDLVLIDAPGFHGDMLRSALVSADVLLAPMQPNYSDGWSLQRELDEDGNPDPDQPPQLAEIVAEAQAVRAEPLRIALVLNRFQPSTKLHQQQLQEEGGLASELPAGFALLSSRIRDLTMFRVAFGHGMTPLQLEPEGKAASDLRALAHEVYRFTKGKHAEESSRAPAANNRQPKPSATRGEATARAGRRSGVRQQGAAGGQAR